MCTEKQLYQHTVNRTLIDVASVFDVRFDSFFTLFAKHRAFHSTGQSRAGQDRAFFYHLFILLPVGSAEQKCKTMHRVQSKKSWQKNIFCKRGEELCINTQRE